MLVSMVEDVVRESIPEYSIRSSEDDGIVTNHAGIAAEIKSKIGYISCNLQMTVFVFRVECQQFA